VVTLVGDQRAARRSLSRPSSPQPSAIRGVWNEAIDRYRETLKARKTVINGLEFAARVNHEIGLGGAGETPAGVTVIFEASARPRAPRSKTAMPVPRGERRFARQLQRHE
jgi:hypothetical protein